VVGARWWETKRISSSPNTQHLTPNT